VDALISFVIPALNEEANIGLAIDSITEHCLFPHEVIVADHGSMDNTRDIAVSKGATVVRCSGGTIGGLRNKGVEMVSGSILVFIDADVVLTVEWQKNITSVVSRLQSGERLVSGSHCSPPESRNLLLKFWFHGLATDPRNTHVGTGHMILSRQGFSDIGGFDNELKTGEDYEFCVRAQRLGYKIENDIDLVVIHDDFPKDLIRFMKREAWHGRGDFVSVGAVLDSKVAVATCLFIGLHLVMLFSGSSTLFGISFFLLLCLLLVSSVVKYKHLGLPAIVVNASIFYFYFCGRAGALLKALALALRFGK
jgi:glycosyltransferase involved in cell wall biosynthesis